MDSSSTSSALSQDESSLWLTLNPVPESLESKGSSSEEKDLSLWMHETTTENKEDANKDWLWSETLNQGEKSKMPEEEIRCIMSSPDASWFHDSKPESKRNSLESSWLLEPSSVKDEEESVPMSSLDQDQKNQASVITAWLKNAACDISSNEEETYTDEDAGSSIVILDENEADDMAELYLGSSLGKAQHQKKEGEDSSGFWLL